MHGISLKKIKVILAAINEKSFTRASIKENISQPAVTNIIKEVEGILEIQVFQKQGGNRCAQLTPEGEYIARVFHKMLYDYEQGINQIKYRHNASKLDSRFEIQSELIHFLNEKMINKISEYSDDVRPHLTSNSRASIIESVQNRQIKIGIIDGGAKISQCEFFDMGSIKVDLAYVMPIDCVESNAFNPSFSVNDIDSNTLILSAVSEKIKRDMKTHFRENGQDMDAFRQVQSVNMLFKLAHYGKTPCLLPAALAKDVFGTENFVIKEVTGMSFELNYGFLVPWGQAYQFRINTDNSRVSLIGQTYTDEI